LHAARIRGKTSDVESVWEHGTAPVTEWGHNGDLSAPAVVAAPVLTISEADQIDEPPRLTRNQRAVMDWLNEGRGVSMRDLAQRLPRAPVTVKSLFHRGLIGYGQRWEEANGGPDDRDRTVRLTPRGKSVMELLHPRDHGSA
jgi:hypothetical protein